LGLPIAIKWYFAGMTEAKPFLVYRSSAGSGKTRSLSKEYLKLALGFRSDYFKHILAVTFTNKATQEMKDRILQYLIHFSSEKVNELASELMTELNLDKRTFVDRSKETLTLLLHNYSRFSVSTIDAFFQRVIRSFTRESGLMGNFRLEIEHDLVLEEVISNLLDDLGQDQDLTRWMLDFSRENLREGSNWNITYALIAFAKEILKEDFKLIEPEILKRASHGQGKAIHQSLLTSKQKFIQEMKAWGQQALDILEKHGVSVEHFANKNSGTAYTFFYNYSVGEFYGPGSRILAANADAMNWVKKGDFSNPLLPLAKGVLGDLLRKMLEYYEREKKRFITIDKVLGQFYQYALVSDIVEKLSTYKTENNIMLLADASQFLNGIINNSDTPFIYEKAGSFYNHFLIDEFQDTSTLQWNNFKPLLFDSLDQNQMNMVVGDVKQSIYRWRGSDSSLLQQKVTEQVGIDRTNTRNLTSNFRSAGHVLAFNNLFFHRAAARVAQITGSPLSEQVYIGSDQVNKRLPDTGFVHFKFYEKWWDSGREQALENTVKLMEEIQLSGHEASAIAILVRKNEDGQDVVNFLQQYQTDGRANPACSYEVVSSDSLRLDSALCVSLLIMAYRVINNPRDKAARGELALAYATMQGMPLQDEAVLHLFLEKFSDSVILNLSSLPVDEVTETLIRIFDLGNDKTELAYLLAFQEVIQGFVSHEKNDINSFLDWWALNGSKKSVQSSGRSDAMNIITIHKAKGLQFKFVLVPFGDWKLDHDRQPIIWCKSNEEPFAQLGYMAVRYTSQLKDSYFEQDYLNEKYKAYLDNLNLLYVALTRAELGLVFFGPLWDNEGDPSNVGELAFDVLNIDPSLKSQWNSNESSWTNGSIPKPIQTVQDQDIRRVVLNGYQAFDWRSKLVIRTEGTEFFLSEKTEQRKKINFGILLHKILSRISYKTDTDHVVRQLISEGIVMHDEEQEVNDLLNQMWAMPLVADWFSKDWTVKTEAPLLVPQNNPERIDRVIFKDSGGKRKAVIIDYKSGEKRKADRDQVLAYARHLQQMGYVDVEGYLLYLFPIEVVPVVSKSTLSLF
jgi:ATP-dependent helicase/nuclease subunit A